MGAKIIAILAAVFLHAPFLMLLDSLFDLRQRVSPAVSNLVAEPLIQNTITSYVLKVISFLAIVFIIYLVATILINIVLRPLLKIKLLRFLDRGAGLFISSVCIILFIALFCGLTEPFWDFNAGFNTAAKSSHAYPILMKIYQPSIKLINVFFGNIFLNPFDTVPTINSVEI